jgi:hypothetical protein
MLRYTLILSLIIASVLATTPLELQQQVSALSTPGTTYYTLGIPEPTSQEPRVLVIKLVVEAPIPFADGGKVYVVASYSPNPTLNSEYVQTSGDSFTYTDSQAPETWVALQLAIRNPSAGTLFIGVGNDGSGPNATVSYTIKAIMAGSHFFAFLKFDDGA